MGVCPYKKAKRVFGNHGPGYEKYTHSIDDRESVLFIGTQFSNLYTTMVWGIESIVYTQTPYR